MKAVPYKSHVAPPLKRKTTAQLGQKRTLLEYANDVIKAEEGKPEHHRTKSRSNHFKTQQRKAERNQSVSSQKYTTESEQPDRMVTPRS